MARRDAIIAEASRQLNAFGAGRLTLASVAGALGITRNALYYYYPSPADLIADCYRAACRDTLNELEAARDATGGDPEAWLTAFIRRALAGAERHRAVVSDLACLPAVAQQEVEAERAMLIRSVSDALADAQATGSFGAFDPDAAATALLGMLDWSRLSAMWLRRRIDPGRVNARAAAIAELLLYGISARREGDLPRPTASSPQPSSTVDRLLDASAWLFNRRGVEGTSLDDICARAGVTKGAVYHHFENKQELTLRCLERAFGTYDALMSAAERMQLPGRDKAAAVFALNCEAQLSKHPPMVLQPGFFGLPGPAATRFIRAARGLAARSDAILRGGQTDGSCRHFGVRDVTEVSAGAFLRLSGMLARDDSLDIDGYVRVLVFGIAAPSG